MCGKIIHYQRYLFASLYHLSAICLINFAQSTLVFLSITSTCRFPFNGSDTRKMLATPQRSYSKSTLACCPGRIFIAALVSLMSCLGDSSIQTTGNDLLYGLLYTSRTCSMQATNWLF